MNRHLRPRVWGFVLLLLASAASTSTVVPMDVGGLTDHAGRIFLGTCVGARGDTLAGAIVTRFTFTIDAGLKGVTGIDTLHVALPGGTFGGVREDITGMPAFVPGDEVVLFLTEDDRRGRAWPVGLAQGDFRVQRRPGMPPQVRQDTAHLRFGASGLTGAAARPAPLPPPTMPLSDLLDMVRLRLGAESSSSGSSR